MGTGAWTAVHHAFTAPKPDSEATFDADPPQMSMMKSGTIQLAIAQEPAVEGADAVQQGLAAINGKTPPKSIATPLIAITPANMNSPSVQPYVYVSQCG